MSTMTKSALVLKHLPLSGVDSLRPRFIDRWKHLSHVGIEHLKANRQGLLLVRDAPEAHWVRDQRRGTRAEPLATKSQFGWVFRWPFSEMG